MQLALIAAVAANGVIGRNNGLPWRLPEDMRHFMRTTLGHPVIMGRRTYESRNAPLPRRSNIVITGKSGYSAPGIEVAADFPAALRIAKRRLGGADTAFAIGGTAIYAEAMKTAHRLLITWVEAEVEGDTWFPEVDWEQWREASSQFHPADADHEHPFRIVIYDRRQRPVSAATANQRTSPS